jgi:hypothetical protein
MISPRSRSLVSRVLLVYSSMRRARSWVAALVRSRASRYSNQMKAPRMPRIAIANRIAVAYRTLRMSRTGVMSGKPGRNP